MIDFIEYVVAELKSKRLSKTNAASLVRQFSQRSPATPSAIHPLLHRNTSDLSEQRYSSTFTGQEFFLVDHQVKAGGQAGRKVLPGVTYLEMARAAVEEALPARPESAALELHNTVWAQPIVVGEQKDVHIALLAEDDEKIDYEVYSQDGDREVVHCQGRAVLTRDAAPAALDLDQLRARMTDGELAPESLYATCTRMGLIYGPSFQGITALHRGAGEVLAELRLPSAAAEGAEDFVLHPSLMDGALQAAVGLLDGGSDETQPRLPFALETLRVAAPCTAQMFAWLRYAPGSKAEDKVVKLDIDLCDDRGNVCVRMRGFSWRVLSGEASLAGSLLAAPVWETSDAVAAEIEFAERHVVRWEDWSAGVPPAGRGSSRAAAIPPGEDARRLAGETPALQEANIAESYSAFAVACFERIQSILQSKPQGKVLFQVVATDDRFAGLSGLLKTAALENPQLVGQVVLVSPGTSVEERGADALVKYEGGVRKVRRWREVASEPAPIAFKEGGVYLITGGTGGLGRLFAREILDRTRDARVILTGRSPKPALVEDRVSYRQVDLTDLDQVEQLIAAILGEHGRLDGILHSAGMIADSFILKKSGAQFRDVLAPKVTGTWNLDQATRDVELDFFVLFSALAGVMGNLGQADYAAANGFMDHFAAHRNRLVAAKERHGRTRAIDWPLWQDGGMGVDAASRERLRETTGMQPMQTATGIEAFHRSLALPHDQLLVVEGDLAQVRRALLAAPVAPHVEQPAPAVAIDAEGLAEKTQSYLRKQFSEVLKVPAQKIDPRAALENYGIDSILAMKLTNQLETTFGSLSKTLFFEYQTIRELAEYFIANHAAQLDGLFRSAGVPPASRGSSRAAVTAGRDAQRLAGETPALQRTRRRRVASAAPDDDPIAIIGLSGRYPEAVDLDVYWENLRDGKDCITEVPKDRWDWREYFSDDRSKSGHHYSKWGGFISGVDEFDPLFFNISPVDAEQIDPQERLFLQHAWMAMEDAGYTRAGLQLPSADLPGQVGVYVGVMYTEYQLFGSKRVGVPGSSATIANRVSYSLNLHGPSMTLDTMCSSSLTAIHVACQDLKQGRTSLAIAGGVNVSIHPNKYLVLSEGQFISSDGHCQSFGEGGDGYIPGEGVGAVILKRLSEAERDGDHIYGVIRGSALTHGGKTNGYSVPNPQAQASAISRALAESKIDPRHISYIEAHGTGTKLGDPIEIAALGKAFGQSTQDTEFCLIGSAKSNIGHCESAAGIAGLTKVLLQMQHRQVVPSLHSAQLNPHIDFGKSPFIVNQTLRPWERPVIDGRTLPRIAGISSFGAGGSNAHILIEEYEAPAAQPVASADVAIVLSARTAAQLQQKARKLVEWARTRENIDLPSLAYTLQVGREPMEERLALLVTSVAELVEKLEAWLAGEQGIEDLHQGQARRNNETLVLFADADLQQAIDRWIASRKISKLLDLWVKGLELDWGKLHGGVRPRRMSLPTYPFARERYWIDTTAAGQVSAEGATTAVLHPLLHRNTSDLSEQRYGTTFTGEEFFLADHQVAPKGQAGQKVLPGVAYLEMARAAIEEALPARPESTLLELHNTVWAQPIVVAEKKDVDISLLADDDDRIDFEIYSQDGDEEVVHCQGRAVLSRQPAPARVDLAQLEAQMDRDSLAPEAVYAALARMGLVYGPAFQGITAIRRGSGQALARLRLPDGSASGYVLHPSLMDGSLQAAVALLDGESDQPRLPFALETLRIVSSCTAEMVAWVRFAPGSQATDSVVKLDIDLCDASGNVCVQMRGFSSRSSSHELGAARARATGSLIATPVWQTSTAASPSNLDEFLDEFAERHVVRCDRSHYSDQAVACFEKIRAIFQSNPEGKVLFQVVVRDDGEQALLAGLSGLLRTAALENPQFIAQLILVPAQMTAEEIERLLESERPLDALVRYENGARQVLHWQEVPAEASGAPIAFREDGVYLITGGTGGLGILFAKEILERTSQARVVLTGRSEKQAQWSPRVSYRQVDLADLEQVTRLVADIRREHGRLDGVLHSAGMIADSFILNKDGAHFRQVLEPKVIGTRNLDQATKDVALDCFVLFSSVAGAAGNIGQADYAAANGFLDQFAAHRNRLVAAKERHGRTRSINWPLWQAGGMTVDAERQEMLAQATGMQPMRTAIGMEAFHRSLALPYDQTLVVAGDLAQLRRTLLAGPVLPVEAEPAVAIDAAGLPEETREWLRKQFAGVLKMPSHKIDPQAALEEYGIDSVLAMKLTGQLEKAFGSLPKTLFFEYQTIDALVGYFTAHHAGKLAKVLAPAEEAPGRDARRPAGETPARQETRRIRRTRKVAAKADVDDDPIAIIGLSGRYPEAVDVEAYWENLRQGKDCITEVPKDRWDWREYFSEDRSQGGRHYSKWGGFIEGVGEFDPLFFHISPVDAELIDPQERLFLQHAWMAIEDAGYTRAGLQVPHEQDLPGQVGVYVGVMWGEYQLFGAEASARGKRLALPGSTASIANRVSYALNLHGPSVTLDTMCSSSLTAIHFACQDLKLGRTSLAIAGGVNVTVHPNKYLVLSAGQFISSDGHCQSFGEGGDGYIPGEGVGAVVLKRLSEAKRDGDHIYGVIRGSALNHGGKTNGYTVPNLQAQAAAISRALAESRTDARHISYIEAHGTGTKLGDPIEIAALSKAFQQSTQETEFCRIGSAKSNIGHCESAAGIAGLTKVLLQMQHREIVPSLHAAQLNPHIDFAGSPFVVNRELTPWEQPVIDGLALPRIAGISSFGAGGSNAHLIVEEYQAPIEQPMPVSKVVIPLSARTLEQLRQRARDLVAYLRPRLGSIDLAALACTLQVGREPMEERLGLIVSSAEELVEKLEAYVAGEQGIEDAYQGQVKRAGEAVSVFSADADLQQTIDKWIANKRLPKLLDLWVKGLDLDWSKLYGAARPRRISLPTYPFARDRYWIDTAAGVSAKGAAMAVLHPLLHSNTSDLSEQRYRSTFTGDEFFLADHQVKGQRVLPGVAQLEMARAAVEQALPERPEGAVLELHDTVWLQPIFVSGSKQVTIALSPDDERIGWEISSEDVVHGQGAAVLSQEPAPAALDLEQLRARMSAGRWERDAVYETCARMGLTYGPSFRAIAAIHRGTEELLAQIRLPETAANGAADYVLHPSLVDGALQACVGLVGDATQPRLPFALETLRILAPCTPEMAAWVRYAPGDKVDIDLCDERGNICVQMRGLSSRVLGSEVRHVLATPVWEAAETDAGSIEFAQRHVIRCEPEPHKSLAQSYSDYAVACFERIQAILRDKPEGKVLVQIVVSDPLLAGLSGLLKSAALENPQLVGQLVEQGVPKVLRWREIEATTAPIAFKSDGIYLITGGLGSLGQLFAREILDRAPGAHVVLTGRSDKQPLLEERLSYRQVDLDDPDQVAQLIAAIRAEHGRLDGILHSAGMIADRFILKKTAAEFRDVLAPKVTGTWNLDQATRDVELDFFVLFSSIAGAMGNVGQADYAAANGFLDQFAAHRNRLVANGQRHGRTRSINWPLWETGGMGADAATRELLQQTTGMQPMQTATGMEAFHRCLALPYDQLLVVEGDPARLRRALLPAAPAAPAPAAPAAEDLTEKTQDYLRREFSELLKLPPQKIDPQAALEQYGIDSILAMRLTSQLEKTFGSLSKTLFFEYQTIAALAGYFVKAHPAVVREKVGIRQAPPAANTDTGARASRPPAAGRPARRYSAAPALRANHPHDIAIVGLSGRYPQAENLQEFWKNLQNGRDSITEVPLERWDHARYFDSDPNKAGKSYSKWGGFIADVDKFDPLFFNISPKEAELIDPQERLFLETAWETIEDAGYTKERIAGGRVGVYVGVMWTQYELFGAESVLRGGSSLPGSSHASIANRVSYFFDFHGPSIALDTMCSSSLTAIHLAVEALRRGEIDAAVAGGVNVTIHPYKYLSLSQGKFAASDGRCRSFGAGGDGYVPGEGVGAVLLKPLQHALRDGDQIYAVIKSSTVNHGGKTNGYTVPNPNAQGDLIRDALAKAAIDPKTLSYIETHGTGTSLGDPIEITGLLKAFEGSSAEKQSCPIGSVKSNIGHLESAAGIAAVTKALLQIRHGQLVPSLHATPRNPNIHFDDSPFYVQTELAEWTRRDAQPRRVGISSFGAGGSNAHLILEEHVARDVASDVTGSQAFVLSARTADALRRYAERVARFLENASGVSLADIAHTSQVGRTPMSERLVILCSSIDDLRTKLHQWIASDDELDGVFQGNARQASAGNLIAGAAGKAFVEALLANGELEKIARLWIMGVDVDWSLLYRGAIPRKVSLPTYPFAKERYWVQQETPSVAVSEKQRTYYYPQWTPKALAAGDGKTVGPILVLDSSEELFRALSGDVLVKPGKSFEETAPNCFVLDPESEEQFRALAQTLEQRGLSPAVVLHHDQGLTPLFHLCKTLSPARVMSVFASNPLRAAIGGFLKTLAVENPSCLVKSVEIEGEISPAIIRDELHDWTSQEIRYRGSVRSVRSLVSRPATPSSALPLKQNGVYLITGGMGGLGILFAEYLARSFRPKLVLIGRSAPNAAQQEKIARLQGYGAEVLVVQADVAKLEEVNAAVREAKARFSRIDGVIHAAGVNRDALILRKSRADMEAVLAPKVQGAINVDLATSGESLDFFVLFSSIAGVLGNAGQCDYAFGNHFLDSFAEARAQKRSGRTLSINWPLWEEGGMHIPQDRIALLEKETGLAPLPAQDGIRYFEDLLRGDAAQGVALYGIPSKIAAFLEPKPAKVERKAAVAVDASTLFEKTEAYLKALIGEEIKLSADRIGSSDPLESFGIDSVMINRINAQLERDLGTLPKTLLYEHETVHELASYLVREAQESLLGLMGGDATPATPPPTDNRQPTTDNHFVHAVHEVTDAIAIIGIHGIYPHSATLDEYWSHLKEGRDLIEPVPADRWDSEELYDPDPAAAAEGKIYCKWGGFLKDHDKFDPHFFKISTAEASVIDPQERLFLESVWAAIEDAGYTRERLRVRFPKAGSADVGVFVGVTTNSYDLWAPEERTRGNFVSPTAMPWSIANRVSYFFDFNGPSLPVDTACSSSLVAIHLACESLRSGECQVAVAGGVNLYLHPAKYQSLCQRRMVSLDGKCHSYGAGDDGFVPGEGVGTLILKPLRKAVEDGDRIHAVIRASAYDHSGRSNGYSAPNPNAQANLIGRTLRKADIHPETIGYVEGHGTGTQLGDSIEVAALTKAFQMQTAKTQFCPIGSVKANIGHAESAAGIAGLAKVILQMRHGQLAPSIHSDEPNPNIEFQQSPFYLQHGLSEWPSPAAHPRRALVNSFGAGGVNACIVVEEYEKPKTADVRPEAGPYLFTLSARNEDRLRDYADRLLAHLRSNPSVEIASLCDTLAGREAMEERLAIVVESVTDVIERLGEWSARGAAPSVHRGSLGPRRGSKRSKLPGTAQLSLAELAAKWVAGEEIEWDVLHSGRKLERVSLPTYPFARERYWVSDQPVPERPALATAAARLHPLIDHNSSTLREVSFTSLLADDEFYAVDHRVLDEPIFPGAGFLEIACMAANIAGEQRVRKIRDIVWIQPLSFRHGAQAVRTVLRQAGEGVEYAISSLDDEGEPIVHSEGRLAYGKAWADRAHAEERVAIDEITAQCADAEDGAAYYEKFRANGLHYGPSFRTIQEIRVGRTFALAKLQAAEHRKGEFGHYILPPTLIDGALQTIAGLAASAGPEATYVPFALDEIEIVKPVTRTCWAYVERADAQQSRPGVTKFNIRLLNESGEVLVKFKNLYVRPLARPQTDDDSMAEAAGE